MIRWTVALPLLAGGCSNFESIADACKDSVAGDRDAPPGGVEVFERLSCYRRYAGLGAARMSPAISDAVSAHVAYLEFNIASDEIFKYDLQLEERSRPGYTGETPIDRFDAAGFETDDTSIQSWSVFAGLSTEEPVTAFIDREIHDPLFRDPFLAPGWQAGSFSVGLLDPTLTFGYLEAALFLPSQQNAFDPVTWPVDDQTGVPTEWINPWPIVEASPPPFDVLPSLTGYPITLTFGSDETAFDLADNPLDVQMRRSRVTGPNGDVEHAILFPGPYFGGVNTSTLGLIPLDPLEPGALYEVEVEVSWVSRDDFTKTFSFRTRNDPGTGFADFP